VFPAVVHLTALPLCPFASPKIAGLSREKKIHEHLQLIDW
jgi:hypothetical protein